MSNIQQLPFREFRSLMPVSRKWAYLDHAAIGPIPEAGLNEIRNWAQQAAHDGDFYWPDWNQGIEQLRSLAADLINARPDEVAIVPNTTYGINLVAEGLSWQAGDNIVTAEGEFPTNLYPWMNLKRYGVETRIVPRTKLPGCDGVDLTRIAEACDDRTRLVSLSWVSFDTGFRIDVSRAAEIAHDHGALFLLDAIQGMGVFPIDVRGTGIDFLSADGHKWMLGPEGAGIFYVRQDNLELLSPRQIGWRSVHTGSDLSFTSAVSLDLKNAASRYEGGSANTVGSLGLLASLSMLQRLGLNHQATGIADRCIELADHLQDELEGRRCRVNRSRDRDQRTGIVAFEIPGVDLQSAREKMLTDGIILSYRAGRIRAAIHGYNDLDDIQRVLCSIDSL